MPPLSSSFGSLAPSRVGLGMCPAVPATTPTRAVLAHALATPVASNFAGHLVIELHGVARGCYGLTNLMDWLHTIVDDYLAFVY